VDDKKKKFTLWSQVNTYVADVYDLLPYARLKQTFIKQTRIIWQCSEPVMFLYVTLYSYWMMVFCY